MSGQASALTARWKLVRADQSVTVIRIMTGTRRVVSNQLQSALQLTYKDQLLCVPVSL